MFIWWKIKVKFLLNSSFVRLKSRTKPVVRLRGKHYIWGDYCSNEFNTFCKENEINNKDILPYTPQSNNIVERGNKTFIGMINVLMSSSRLPKNLWGETVLTTCVILCRVSFNFYNDDGALYELWKEKKLNLYYFKI